MSEELFFQVNTRFTVKFKVQQEIDLQVKVSQDFNRNVQAANGEINKQIDTLKQQLDKGQISQAEYDRKVSNWQQGSVLLNSIAAGLGAPTDSVAGIATATLAPAVSYQIGQEFKKSNEEGSLKHILAHAIVGAVVAQSGGNNALAGALSAGGAEALAPRVAEYLYGKKGSELNAEQKETVSSIMSLAGAASGYAVGGDTANAQVGGVVAKNAVENNYLTALQYKNYINQLEECNHDIECYKKVASHFEEIHQINRRNLQLTCNDRNSVECKTLKTEAQQGLLETLSSKLSVNLAVTLPNNYKNDTFTDNDIQRKNLEDIAYAETNRGNAQAIQAALNNHTVNDGLIYKVATNTLNEHNPSIWRDPNLAIDTTINTGKSTATKTIDKIETGINDTIDDIKKSYDDLTERPKETISQWWEDKKETGKNVKDFVVDMATNPTVREEASDSVFENIDKNIQKGKHNLDLLKMGNPHEVEDIVSDTTSDGIIEIGQAAAGGVVTKAGGVAIGGITKDKDTPKNVNNKDQVDTDYVKSNIEKNKIARESSNFDIEHQKRTEHNVKLTTTVDGNLSVTHGLSYDAKKELDGIRAFLVENKKSVLNAKSKSPNNLTIATAEVIENNGSITNYLAVSGKAEAISSKISKDNFGREFVDISIDGNQTRYFIIRQSPSGVNQPYNYATPKGDNNKFDNVNHAEEKLMGFLTQNLNISSVKLKVQNTDDEVHGLCKGCGGKYSESSYENKQNGSTLEDFSRKNTFKIHVEHGSTSQR